MDAITAVVVEPGGRGMSPDTITTIALAVLGVIGTLCGVWWGQVLEDKRRRCSRVARVLGDDHLLELVDGRTIGYATWGDPGGRQCS